MIRIKICGITRPEDAMAAYEEGADFIGLVFAPSPRRIDRRQAGTIIEQIPDFKNWVGVFVNEQKETVEQIALSLGIRYLQLHGDESPFECEYFEQKGFKVIKAHRIRNMESFDKVDRYATPFTLLDSYSPASGGGTGEPFEWQLLAGRKLRGQIFVSGGLGPNNLENVVQYFTPFAFDVSSGVELAPGVKSREKIHAFVKASRKFGKAYDREFRNA